MGRSQKTFENYGRHLAAIALHFGRTPLKLNAEEVREYLYELQKRSQTPCQSYFKHTVFGLRFLLKSEGLPYNHLLLPEIKKEKKLPSILSKEEVWRMFYAPKLLKHRILLGLLTDAACVVLRRAMFACGTWILTESCCVNLRGKRSVSLPKTGIYRPE